MTDTRPLAVTHAFRRLWINGRKTLCQGKYVDRNGWVIMNSLDGANRPVSQHSVSQALWYDGGSEFTSGNWYTTSPKHHSVKEPKR